MDYTSFLLKLFIRGLSIAVDEDGRNIKRGFKIQQKGGGYDSIFSLWSVENNNALVFT